MLESGWQTVMALPVKTEQDLRKFYSDSGEADIVGKRLVRCVVLGESDPDWHHLDDNHANNDIGNIIPLAPRLNQYLGGIKPRTSVKVQALFDEHLQTSYLINVADTLIAEWRFGRAIGCLRLALYLARPPYKVTDDDLRLEIACSPIRHLRHHVNPGILHTTLRDVQSILATRRFAAAKILAGLEYDLVALLNEHGEYERAGACADVMRKSLSKDLEQTVPLEKLGSMKRRVYQVALLDTTRFSVPDLLAELAELEESRWSEAAYPLKVSVSNTNVLAALQEGEQGKLRAAYDDITSFCADFEPLLEKGRKPAVGPSDLAEIFLYRAVLAMLVQPSRHLEIARTCCDRARGLFGECHALLTNQYREFWDDVLRHRALAPSAERSLDPEHPVTQLAQLITKQKRPGLRAETAQLVMDLFAQATQMIAVP